MADLAKEEIAAAEAMKAERSTFDDHWEDVRTYIHPLVASFTGTNTPGEKGRREILDNTGESVAEQLAAALHGFLTNPGTKWMAVRAKDRALNDVFEVARWLELANEWLFFVFESKDSGFATMLSQIYLDVIDFATTGVHVRERPGRLPLFQARPLSELYLAEGEDGRVDTVRRWFKLTARQAVQIYGDQAGAKVIEAARSPKRQNEKFAFLHSILPRDEHAHGASNMPIASIHISVADQAIIGRIAGFNEKPLITPRWAKRAGEAYGRGSPGMKSLADVKMLQRTMRATIVGAELSIRPPLTVADDGVLSPVRWKSGAITRVRGETLSGRRGVIEPMKTGARPDIGEEFMVGIRQRIENAYFLNLIQLSRDPRMTATQVLSLEEETKRVIGPFLARLQEELLEPLIVRTFNILLRAGVLPPPPAELRQVEVEFVSPIAKAQRLSEVRAISQLNEVMAPMVGLDPTLQDNLDGDLAYRHAADRLGVPKILMRDPRQRDALRQQRAEAEKAQAEMQTVERGAAAAQSAGQAAAAFAGAARTTRDAAAAA